MSVKNILKTAGEIIKGKIKRKHQLEKYYNDAIKARERLKSDIKDLESKGVDVPNKWHELANRDFNKSGRITKKTRDHYLMLVNRNRLKSLAPKTLVEEIGGGDTEGRIEAKIGESNAHAWAAAWKKAAIFQTRKYNSAYGNDTAIMTDWGTIKTFIKAYQKTYGEDIGDWSLIKGHLGDKEAVAKYMRSISIKDLEKMYERTYDDGVIDFMNIIFDRPWSAKTQNQVEKSLSRQRFATFVDNRKGIEVSYNSYKWLEDNVFNTREWDIFKESQVYDSDEVELLTYPEMRPANPTEFSQLLSFLSSTKFNIKILWDIVFSRGVSIGEALTELGF